MSTKIRYCRRSPEGTEKLVPAPRLESRTGGGMNKEEIRSQIAIGENLCREIEDKAAEVRVIVAQMENPCGLQHEVRFILRHIENISEAIGDMRLWRYEDEEGE